MSSSSARALTRGLTVVRLLRERPYCVRDLATALRVSRDTVERILRGLRDAGYGLTSRKVPCASGQEVWYSLPPETLRRTVP